MEEKNSEEKYNFRTITVSESLNFDYCDLCQGTVHVKNSKGLGKSVL